MNIYKVLFTHTAPKKSKEGIMTYLLAENEEQVYSFIDKQYNREYWKGNEEDEDREPINIYDEDYNVTGTKTFKEYIIDLKGEMNDEDYDYSDAYCGITLYGWELVKENVTSDYSEMIALNVFKNCL
jgi:hypothetical protein